MAQTSIRPDTSTQACRVMSPACLASTVCYSIADPEKWLSNTLLQNILGARPVEKILGRCGRFVVTGGRHYGWHPSSTA
ncbi:hypothetical protein [Frankia sp. R82]|uniref:hypothetical protein n=1 Tax=Frankia sp. R82 TaxID=2950553 RepID=UPI002044C411|nr:hypothetical protein [Frankia sp. R82]MCM3882242.1 hypothetical protein [Frankia sp. R82]